MSNWRPCGAQKQFEPGINGLKPDGAPDLVVVRDSKDALHVFTDLCPHRGAPFTDVGLMEDDQLICGWHYWAFRLSDGVNPAATEHCVRKWPSRVVDGELLVDLTGACDED